MSFVDRNFGSVFYSKTLKPLKNL